VSLSHFGQLDNVEGIVFNENPLDFFIILARYKFGTKSLNSYEEIILSNFKNNSLFKFLFIESWTENPCVGVSIPPLGTTS